METAIVFSPNDLRALIADTVNACLTDWQPGGCNPPKPEYDGISAAEAVDFLAANGYPIAMQTLYGLVHKRQIPYHKRGKRLLFSRRELLAWLQEGRLQTATERLDGVVEQMATSRRKK